MPLYCQHPKRRTPSKSDTWTCGATVRATFEVWACHHWRNQSEFMLTVNLSHHVLCRLAGELQAGLQKQCDALVEKCYGWHRSEVLPLWWGWTSEMLQRWWWRTMAGWIWKHVYPGEWAGPPPASLMVSLAIFGGFLKAPFPSALWLSDNVVFYLTKKQMRERKKSFQPFW